MWRWRLADDQWPQARQQRDYGHAVKHLAGWAGDVLGRIAVAWTAWLERWKPRWKNGSEAEVFGPLEERPSRRVEVGPAREVTARGGASLRDR